MPHRSGFAVRGAGGACLTTHASYISALAGPSLRGDSSAYLTVDVCGEVGTVVTDSQSNTPSISIIPLLATGPPPLGLFAEYLYRVGAKDE
jgi:hypothetical protein